jgi:hypothetical protein
MPYVNGLINIDLSRDNTSLLFLFIKSKKFDCTMIPHKDDSKMTRKSQVKLPSLS